MTSVTEKRDTNDPSLFPPAAEASCVGRLCGGSQAHEEAPPTEAPEKLPDIGEEPAWRHVVDANALIMMAAAVFMWGYYA